MAGFTLHSRRHLVGFAARPLALTACVLVLHAQLLRAQERPTDVLKRFGTISLATALTPGIQYAERGFSLTPKFRADLVSLKDRVTDDPALAAVILKDGEIPETGSLIRQPDLARPPIRCDHHDCLCSSTQED